MVHSASKRLPFRRRRRSLTNYRSRLALLKSRRPRVVVRCSNNQTLVQLVRFSDQGDQIVTSAISKQLRELGWNGGLSNLPAAYLTGFMAGKKALKEGLEEGVLDLGLANAHVPGSKVYATLKGLVEAGLKIPHSKKVLPSADRVTGQHLGDPKTIETEMAKVKAALEKV